jgi:arsenate reductase
VPHPYNYAIKNKIKGKFMQLYGLKACDSCRKARKALQNQQVDYIDVREGQVPDAVLEAALVTFGDALLNCASTTWRGLDEVARTGEPLALLKAHPTLMKRPLIVHDGEMTLGWKPDVAAHYAALLGA